MDDKKVTFSLIFLVILTLVISYLSLNSEPEPSYEDIAQSIQHKFDQELDNFSDYKAGHYAARIYRISGDTSHLKYSLQDLSSIQKQAAKFLQIARNDGEVEYSKSLVDTWSPGNRSDLRRESHTIAPAFPFQLRSLNILRRSSEYRICSPQLEHLKEHILAHDFTHELSNPFMVKAWAAQLANVVAWVKQLGGEDYSELFNNTLQTVYPDNQDHLLTTQQYENKIYGLTHIILAGSQYYQYKINRDDFLWIFDYFDINVDTIISRAKADVIAEVGIAYLLSGDHSNPALKNIKQGVARQFDITHNMIPSVEGDFVISSGSHRNVLAIMLLSSTKEFFLGPWLSQIDSILLPAGMHSCIPTG